MTCQDFMAMIEKYYGPYQNRYQREIILGYVEQEFNDNDLPTLYKKIIEIFSSQYKTQPDISVINQARREFNDDHGDLYIFADGMRKFLGTTIGVKPVVRDEHQKQISKTVKQLGDDEKT